MKEDEDDDDDLLRYVNLALWQHVVCCVWVARCWCVNVKVLEF